MLCAPEDDVSDPLVHRAGLPVKFPPGVNLDELTGDPLPRPAFPPEVFNKPLDKSNDEPRDLDPETEHDDDADSVLVEELCANLMNDFPAD